MSYVQDHDVKRKHGRTHNSKLATVNLNLVYEFSGFDVADTNQVSYRSLFPLTG